MITANTAPLSIGSVTLTVHDLDGVSRFYRTVIGLQVLASEAGQVTLGVDGATLLTLRQDKAARRRSPREAGLFHTAFLLPSRADLGRWVRHVAQAQTPVAGASDHLVSEALYLTDPEGNGVEVYADRPSNLWTWQDRMVQMATEQLDIQGLITSAGNQPWQGAPVGSVIGHVHLQVGEIAAAEAFYTGDLGFDLTCRYPGGSFFSSGGYHHHLAANIWNSRGAPVLEQPATGLADVLIVADPARAAALAISAPTTLHDPWGTAMTVSPRQGN